MKLPKQQKNKGFMKKRHRLLPVITRIGNKFYYSKYITKYMKKITKQKLINTPNQCQNIRKVKRIKMVQLLKNYKVENKKQILSEPFLITNIKIPNIVMPQELQVMIHQGQILDYTGDNTFFRIKTEQLYEQFQAKKQELNTKKLNFSVPQMELNKYSYSIPKLVSTFFQTLHKVNLWLYFGNRTTSWHYDGHDNFLYVLEGEKIIYLAAPEAIKKKNIFSLFNNHSRQVNYQQIDLIKAIIRPGSCIYIPKGWWHKVESYGAPCKALNFWGNSISSIIKNLSQIQKTLLLRHLLFQKGNSLSQKNVKDWEDVDECEKEVIRRCATHIYLDYE